MRLLCMGAAFVHGSGYTLDYDTHEASVRLGHQPISSQHDPSTSTLPVA